VKVGLEGHPGVDLECAKARVEKREGWVTQPETKGREPTHLQRKRVGSRARGGPRGSGNFVDQGNVDGEKMCTFPQGKG